MNTQEDLPITPPPSENFTARDGIRLFALLDSGLKRISSAIEEFSNRLAIAQKNDIEILKLLKAIQEGLVESRFGRMEAEIKETEQERDLALLRLKAVEEKLQIKQTAKETTRSTDERIKDAAATALSDVEATRKKKLQDRIDNLKWAVIQGIVLTIGVGAALGILRFFWYLFQLWQASQGKT